MNNQLVFVMTMTMRSYYYDDDHEFCARMCQNDELLQMMTMRSCYYDEFLYDYDDDVMMMMMMSCYYDHDELLYH